jgi:A/G-specific adenine glycosylase
LGSAPRHRVFSRRVRAWYSRVGRDLPWRRTRDPYQVLVSELMLQQTQVSRVLGFYEAFLARFPTLQAVGAARRTTVVRAWKGLGYYARARNLHALARAIGQGTLPADPAALRTLPGIGAYTAGAIASFAYERRAALVDTNVARVLLRVFAPALDPRTARGRRAAWALAQEILPRTGRATYAHNQALMELGAVICTARVRHCGQCPVWSVCATVSSTGRRTGAARPVARQQNASGARRHSAARRTR